MENIYTILDKELGVSVADDKRETFEKALFSNYKTVSELENLKNKYETIVTERDNIKNKYDTDITSRDKDLLDLKSQLESAGSNDNALKDLQAKFEELTNNYSQEKTNYEKKLAEQKYEFAVREKVNNIKFTSNSAKKAFLSEVMNKKLQMDGDKLLGFDDFVLSYKEQDEGAFYSDKQSSNEDKPFFSSKTGSTHSEDSKQSEQKSIPKIW